jgi:pentatricopeptide repeat protein
MQEEGVRPTRCTFNTIINAQKVCGDMVSAERWVQRLLEAGVKPSVVTYTTMISGFAQAGDVPNANKWFQALLDAGCRPTEHTHNAIVYAHCQAGDLPAAEDCLHAYLSSPDLQSHPSIVAFNTIIHACGRLGRSDKAIYWFHEVVNRGLVPSNSTFCAVLNAFAEVGAFSEIEKYSELMASYGLPVADISYRALIKACTHQGDYQKAEQLFEQILERGDSAVSTFNTMIHACTQTGDIESAERYFRIMEEEKGIEPCIVTYNTIINACAGLGDTDRAEKWLMRMVNKEVVPNEVTYGTLCKAFARQGDVVKVKRILHMLQEQGYSLNEYFFASLISACGVAQPPDVATAEEAFEDFVRRGFKPQRVHRVLARVVGDRRASQLLSNIMRTNSGSGQASRPRAARIPPAIARRLNDQGPSDSAAPGNGDAHAIVLPHYDPLPVRLGMLSAQQQAAYIATGSAVPLPIAAEPYPANLRDTGASISCGAHRRDAGPAAPKPGGKAFFQPLSPALPTGPVTASFVPPRGGHLLTNSARVTTERPTAGDGQLASQLARFATPGSSSSPSTPNPSRKVAGFGVNPFELIDGMECDESTRFANLQALLSQPASGAGGSQSSTSYFRGLPPPPQLLPFGASSPAPWFDLESESNNLSGPLSHHGESAIDCWDDFGKQGERQSDQRTQPGASTMEVIESYSENTIASSELLRLEL